MRRFEKVSRIEEDDKTPIDMEGKKNILLEDIIEANENHIPYID